MNRMTDFKQTEAKVINMPMRLKNSGGVDKRFNSVARNEGKGNGEWP